MPRVRELANPVAERRRRIENDLAEFCGARAITTREFAKWYGCEEHAAARMLKNVRKVGKGLQAKRLIADIAAELSKEIPA